MDLSNLRKEYTLKSLRKNDLHADPIAQFEQWFKEAKEAEICEPNAMALSTVDQSGIPSCRMVLLKQFSHAGFIFFTHQTSRKARQMQANPYAAALFFWKEIERQIHIEGLVENVPSEVALAYFKKRPRNSQLAAWASHQDDLLPSRLTLEEKFTYYREFFQDQEILAPDWWVGYQIIPMRMEFWQGRESRLHDRFLYLKQQEGWSLERLSP